MADTIDVLDADGIRKTVQVPNPPARAAENESRSVVLCNEDKAQLDKVAAAAKPTSSGNLNANTNATGNLFTTFAAQACSTMVVVNNTGTTIEVQQGGAGSAFPVFDKQGFEFRGITNANQLGVRRVDLSNTPVTVNARWEA